MITMLMMAVANGWAYNLIADEQRHHLPEVPKSSLSRLSTGESPRQPSEDQEHDHSRQELQHHEFRDLKTEDSWQLDLEACRKLKEREVPDVVKIVLMLGTHRSAKAFLL